MLKHLLTHWRGAITALAIVVGVIILIVPRPPGGVLIGAVLLMGVALVALMGDPKMKKPKADAAP